MVEGISPISAQLKLAQLLGDDNLMAQAPTAPTGINMAQATPLATGAAFPGNAFDDILGQAIQALEGVSKTEVYANQMIEKYIRGEAELQDVMVAQSKMGIVAQLAVTTVNTAVTTFKEITQIQI